MIELPVLIENIIEIVNVAIEMRLCEKISVNSKTVIKVIYWSD